MEWLLSLGCRPAMMIRRNRRGMMWDETGACSSTPSGTRSPHTTHYMCSYTRACVRAHTQAPRVGRGRHTHSLSLALPHTSTPSGTRTPPHDILLFAVWSSTALFLPTTSADMCERNTADARTRAPQALLCCPVAPSCAANCRWPLPDTAMPSSRRCCLMTPQP